MNRPEKIYLGIIISGIASFVIIGSQVLYGYAAILSWAFVSNILALCLNCKACGESLITTKHGYCKSWRWGRCDHCGKVQ